MKYIQEKNIMNMQEIYETIARKNGVSVEEVKAEMKKAVDMAQASEKDDTTSQLWQYIPHEGAEPTPEDLITYLARQLGMK